MTKDRFRRKNQTGASCTHTAELSGGDSKGHLELGLAEHPNLKTVSIAGKRETSVRGLALLGAGNRGTVNTWGPNAWCQL